MKIIFVSGWAGYPELFPELPPCTFLLPFLRQSPGEITSILNAKCAEILIGWSFGAFCILRDLPQLAVRYKKIILTAPFQSFSRWHPKSELDRLETALARSPQRTLNAFWRTCDCPLTHSVPERDLSFLIKGLKIIRQSNMRPSPCRGTNLTFVHGLKDKIVPPQASKDLSFIYPQSQCLFLPENGHWISAKTILGLCNEDIYQNSF